MASFIIAFKRTDKNEGGYSDDPNDMGGETWKGIARKKNPGWPGWKIIDAYKGHPKFPDVLHNDKSLENLRISWYEDNCWKPIRGNEIKSQDLANEIYDTAVNNGVSAAVKFAQRIKGNKETGIMDDLTIRELNNAA